MPNGDAKMQTKKKKKVQSVATQYLLMPFDINTVLRKNFQIL